MIRGSARGILDYVGSQDVVTFTGSADTGRMLKSSPRIISEAVPFNMEADSLNCIVLGEDAAPGTEEFDLFVKEVRREMTTKCGQKCTAIRRIIVPEKYMEDAQIHIGKALSKTTIESPSKDIRLRVKFTDKIYYAIDFKGETVMWFSPLSIGLEDRQDLGTHPKLKKKSTAQVDEQDTYSLGHSCGGAEYL